MPTLEWTFWIVVWIGLTIMLNDLLLWKLLRFLLRIRQPYKPSPVTFNLVEGRYGMKLNVTFKPSNDSTVTKRVFNAMDGDAPISVEMDALAGGSVAVDVSNINPGDTLNYTVIASNANGDTTLTSSGVVGSLLPPKTPDPVDLALSAA